MKLVHTKAKMMHYVSFISNVNKPKLADFVYWLNKHLILYNLSFLEILAKEGLQQIATNDTPVWK